MRYAVTFACAMFLAGGVAWADPEPVLDAAARAQLERLITTRGFTRGLPRDAMPAPDGKRVYFLRSGPTDNRQLLYVLELARGKTRVFVTPEMLAAEGSISKEEQARRERQRQTERGITGFQVSRDGRSLLIPYSGDLFVVDAARGKVRRLTETKLTEIDPHLAPNARHVAFVRGRDLVVLDIDSRRETVIAHSDDPNITYGQAEFVAQEEMDRNTGHWWAPDSRHLALTSVDNREVPTFRVPDFSDPTGEGSASPYPKAGDRNAVVRLGVMDLQDLPGPTRSNGAESAQLSSWESAVRWFDLGTEFDYLARVDWAPDSKSLWIQTQPRSQKRLELRCIDLRSGTSRMLVTEEDRDWVNLHDDFRFIGKGERFLWSSERSGHKHLEVWTLGSSGPATRERVLTSGDWDVVRVLDVDAAHGDVTFSGTRDGVLEQHLYRVPLGGGAVRRLTTEPGWHEAAFNREAHAIWVETFSDERTPTRLRVRDRDGKLRGEPPSEALVPTAEDLGPAPQFLHFAPGGIPIDVRLVHPPLRAGAKLPLIVYVYAGPGSQQVRRSWPGERGLFDGWLARRGFAVARLDGRGVGARGHASERIYARRLGDAELADQVAGVRALVDRMAWIDRDRVGVWGWSYGGYMTLMALLRAPEVFRAGVSVAPVVDWRGYDTHYTERYLGLPSENAAGYDSSSVLTYARNLRGHLTLVHGTTDDNVHFRESMQLVRTLVEGGKQFDLMVYPGTHMMESLPERAHVYELVWRAFATHL